MGSAAAVTNRGFYRDVNARYVCVVSGVSVLGELNRNGITRGLKIVLRLLFWLQKQTKGRIRDSDGAYVYVHFISFSHSILLARGVKNG